jgi:radical SAM superfamily enzyme YgiQ (UPF0313 family)
VKASLRIDNGTFGAGYTETLLRSLCSRAGIELVSDAEAELMLVSLCDPSDLHLLKDARIAAGDRPVVAGGFECYYATPLMAWADHAVLGEGFEWFAAVGAGLDWRRMPFVLGRGGRAAASYSVDWAALPLVKTGKRKMYYLGGRGCHNKCRFCATSWVQPYRVQGRQSLLAAAAAARGAGCGVTFICNDSRDMPRLAGVNAASVTVRDYLKAPDAYRATMLHFGIEGWTAEERAAYGKPLADDDIAALVDATAKRKQRCELFTIAGRPGWTLDHVRDFAAVLPMDASHLPPVFVKLTYFDPCPHTPMARECPATEWVDIERAFRILNARNKRFRVFPVRSLARSNWRTVLHRCTPSQAMLLGDEPTDTNMPGSRAAFLSYLTRRKLDHLAGPIEFDPCQNIGVKCKA